MNQSIYEQLELDLEKKDLFVLVCLANKPSSNIIICLWTCELDLIVYLSKSVFIILYKLKNWWCKFVNKFK